MLCLSTNTSFPRWKVSSGGRFPKSEDSLYKEISQTRRLHRLDGQLKPHADPNFVVHVSRIFTKPSPNIINAIVKLANDNTRTGDGNTQEQRAIFTLNKLGVRELVQWRKMPSSSIMHSFVLVTVRSLLIELPLFSISLKAIAAFWCRWMLENVKIASMSVCRDRTEKYLILTLKIDSIPPKLFTELVFMALSWIVGKPHEIHEGIWIHHIRLVSHL